MFSAKVIALKAHNYGGKRRQKDMEYFITNPVHAKLLTTIKVVRLVHSLIKESEMEKMPIEKKKKKKKKKSTNLRVYVRKDLVVEGSTKTERKIKRL